MRIDCPSASSKQAASGRRKSIRRRDAQLGAEYARFDSMLAASRLERRKGPEAGLEKRTFALISIAACSLQRILTHPPGAAGANPKLTLKHFECSQKPSASRYPAK